MIGSRFDPKNTRPASVVRGDLHRTISSGVQVSFIAATAGLHPTTVSRINTGKAERVTLFVLGSLVDALDRIDTGRVPVPADKRRDPALAPVQTRKQATCGRGHAWADNERRDTAGARYCFRCQRLAGYRHQRKATS